MTVVAAKNMRVCALALLVWSLGFVNLCRAQEPSAVDFIETFADKQCDDANRAWAVLNKHTYLSIEVTLQWHPVGGKEMQEKKVLAPLQRLPVGCAPSVTIVSAQLMQF